METGFGVWHPVVEEFIFYLETGADSSILRFSVLRVRLAVASAPL